MDEKTLNKLKELVNRNYASHRCGWTYQRSEGNFCDCFDDGYSCGSSWLAYELGCLLGMELEEPEEADEE